MGWSRRLGHPPGPDYVAAGASSLESRHHSATNRLELEKGALICRFGVGDVHQPVDAEIGYPFALLPLGFVGTPSTAVPERDAVCLKRAEGGAGPGVLTHVGAWLAEAGIAHNADAVWGHNRPQPQRGPRKLLATGGFKFCPADVPLADLTMDSVGQVLPARTLKDYMMVFDMRLVEQRIEPLNGTSLAALVTRKKRMIPCLRVLRVSAASA